jgi:hypothetical protein
MTTEIGAGSPQEIMQDTAKAYAEAIFQRTMAGQTGMLESALGNTQTAINDLIAQGIQRDDGSTAIWSPAQFNLPAELGGAVEHTQTEQTDAAPELEINESTQANLVNLFEKHIPACDQLPNWVMPTRWSDYKGIDGIELIQNGGFEDHANLNGESAASFEQVTGWKVTEGPVEIQEGAQEGTPEVHDSQSMLRLGGDGQNAGTTLEQTVRVRNEGVHEFKFDFSPCGEEGTQTQEPSQIEILVNGDVVATVSSDEVGFEAHEFRVYLPAGENTVGFREAGTEDSAGGLIDNVSLRRSGAQHPGDVCNVDDMPMNVYFPAWMEGLSFPKQPPVMPSFDLDIDVDIEININYPEAPPQEYEGVVEVTQGKIYGDPHFVGADGGTYDVQGEAGKCYNILSDSGVQMNATFKEYTNPGTTVVEQVGFTTEAGKFSINADGSVEILNPPPPPGMFGTALYSSTVTEPGTYLDGAITINDQGHVLVKAGEYEINFNNFDTRAGGFIDNIEIRSDDANSDGKLPSGLWGATVDGDGIARNGDQGSGMQGGGAIEDLDGEITGAGDKTTVELYEVGGIFDTEFDNFNVFQAPEPAPGDFEIDINISIDSGHYNYASVLRNDDPEQKRFPTPV